MTNEEYIEFVKDKYFVLFGYALKLTGHREDAEDLIQEALIKLWKAKNKISKNKNPLSYAYSTIRNLFIDGTRKNELKEVPLDLIEDRRILFDVDGTAVKRCDVLLAHIEDDFRYKKILKIIRTLPEKQRNIIWLRDVKGLSVKETAKKLKLNPALVKVYLSRARKHIKYSLEKEKENERD